MTEEVENAPIDNEQESEFSKLDLNEKPDPVEEPQDEVKDSTAETPAADSTEEIPGDEEDAAAGEEGDEEAEEPEAQPATVVEEEEEPGEEAGDSFDEKPAAPKQRRSSVPKNPLPPPGTRRFSFGSTLIEQPRPEIKSDPNYVPSDRLTHLTQAQICAIKELEANKGKIKPEDDPWWDKRRPYSGPGSASVTIKNNAQSKLMEPTTAWKSAQREKILVVEKDKEKSGLPEKSPVKSVSHKPINTTSPLLKPTLTSLYGMWHGNEPPRPPSDGDFKAERRKSQASGPQNVQSKLHSKTKAAEAASWKSKKQEEEDRLAEEQARRAAAPKVKIVSDRLTAPNTSMRVGQRAKKVDEPVDPREAGWKDTSRKVSIPVDPPLPLPGAGAARRGEDQQVYYEEEVQGEEEEGEGGGDEAEQGEGVGQEQGEGEEVGQEQEEA